MSSLSAQELAQQRLADVTGIDEKGENIDVRDPLAMRMMAISADAGGDAEALYEGLVGLVEVFGTDLADNQAFGETVATHLDGLFENGVKATVAGVVETLSA